MFIRENEENYGPVSFLFTRKEILQGQMFQLPISAPIKVASTKKEEYIAHSPAGEINVRSVVKQKLEICWG